MPNLAFKAVSQYQSADHSAIAYADPHELILRLMNGAIERIAQARGALSRGDTAAKAEFISKAVQIIGGLEGCVDHQQGGELAGNLTALYQYMGLTLAEANLNDDIAKLNEVSGLLGEIRSAWAQISQPEQPVSA
ncbi:MAG: flagellar export chaperone FliS [Gammaproteobacteria bacterium]|nr:flagellar export chaperone FliS [Gammaproteobacteria bacterium]